MKTRKNNYGRRIKIISQKNQNLLHFVGNLIHFYQTCMECFTNLQRVGHLPPLKNIMLNFLVLNRMLILDFQTFINM